MIHNNASSSEKMFWSESGEKSAQIKQRLQDKTVQNSSKQICGWILMRETTGDGLFYWRKRYYGLWTCVLAGSDSHLLQFVIEQKSGIASFCFRLCWNTKTRKL